MRKKADTSAFFLYMIGKRHVPQQLNNKCIYKKIIYYLLIYSVLKFIKKNICNIMQSLCGE